MRLVTISLFTFLLIAISACDSGTDSRSAPGPLTIDGSSIETFRSSSEKMVTACAKDVDAIVKLANGFLAAKYSAGKALRRTLSLATSAILKMSVEESDAYASSLDLRQEKIQAIILDGMTSEEIMEYGQDFEFAIELDDVREDGP